MELILANLAAAAAGLVPILYALLAAMFLDTITGIYAAWQSGSLNAEFFPTFITSHLVKKVTPIMFTLIGGVVLGGTAAPAGIALVAAGGIAATAYLASVVASIKDNLDDAGDKTKGLPSSVEIDQGTAPTGTPPTP